jgi:glycine/D-amino acid oxidase-like deaminating enzyme
MLPLHVSHLASSWFGRADSMPLREKSFWTETVSMPVMDASRPLPPNADIAVIGGGYTGLAAALTLARHGARVVVLEAQTLGWGASSRNAGMALTGLKLPVETLMRRYGLETARRMYAASLASIDHVEQLVKEESIDCDFRRSGHLEVASKTAHYNGFQRSAELMAREFGHRVRVLPKGELREEIGSVIYHGGLVDEASAGINPARYVAGLAQAAAAAGADLHDHTRLEAVERASRNGVQGFALRTSRGPVWARNVFLASGGYTNSATPSLQRKIIPIGSYIIVTGMLPDALAREVSPRGRMIYDSKHYLHYYRLTPDGRMLFGGRAAFFPETAATIRRSAAILQSDMLQVYPQLRDVEVEYAWGGTLDFAFDVLPHAGQLDDGMYFAAGYAGHGVAMATYLGTKMAERILGGENDLPFADIPFPGAPLGLYDGRPWFLPLAGAWYKFLDWIS